MQHAGGANEAHCQNAQGNSRTLLFHPVPLTVAQCVLPTRPTPSPALIRGGRNFAFEHSLYFQEADRIAAEDCLLVGIAETSVGLIPEHSLLFHEQIIGCYQCLWYDYFGCGRICGVEHLC